MRLQAVLSRKTSDEIKSKLLSPTLAQLVIDVYITPEQYAQLINEFFDKDFVLEIKDAESN